MVCDIDNPLFFVHPDNIQGDQRAFHPESVPPGKVKNKEHPVILGHGRSEHQAQLALLLRLRDFGSNDFTPGEGDSDRVVPALLGGSPGKGEGRKCQQNDN